MKLDPDATWFTSDTHYHHKNIVRILSDWTDKDDCRSFDDINDMDDTIVNAICRVPKDHALFHLGDVAFGGIAMVEEFARRVNRNSENTFLILGNHDQSELQKLGVPETSSELLNFGRYGFHSVKRYDEIKIAGQRITLCHYAMRVWNKSHRGAWQLYGHSHGTLPDDPKALSIDVGLDAHPEFRPFSFREIETIMKRKHYQPVDPTVPTHPTERRKHATSEPISRDARTAS